MQSDFLSTLATILDRSNDYHALNVATTMCMWTNSAIRMGIRSNRDVWQRESRPSGKEHCPKTVHTVSSLFVPMTYKFT